MQDGTVALLQRQTECMAQNGVPATAAPPSLLDLSRIAQPDKQNSRIPTGITPRIGVGCQSFILPSSVDYDCDEGCNVATLRFTLLLYHRLRQNAIPNFIGLDVMLTVLRQTLRHPSAPLPSQALRMWLRARLRCQDKQGQPSLALDDLKTRTLQQFLHLLQRESHFEGAKASSGDLKIGPKAGEEGEQAPFPLGTGPVQVL